MNYLTPLYLKIFGLRAAFAKAAQRIYDEWQQDEDGDDPEHGTGGICSDIMYAMAAIAGRKGLSTLEAGQDGDDHSWLLVYDDHNAYEVDIPYSIYEYGGGFQWTKKPGVTFRPEDVVISPVDRKLIEPEEHYYSPVRESRAKTVLRQLGESVNLQPFLDLARKYPDVEEFIRKTDGMDVLYRGHYHDEMSNNVFMTDYVGHAYEYASGSDEGRVDAFVVDFNEILFFDDDTFNELRRFYLSAGKLQNSYREALAGNVHAAQFQEALPLVKKFLQSGTPYSEISGNYEENDMLIPLMQKFARDVHGKNIIGFYGGDYSEYGGQNEFVVGDTSNLVNLRKLHASVHLT